jgi:hypothetical protein
MQKLPLWAGMASRHYTIWLDESTYIVVDFQSIQGEIVAFVVRLAHIREGVDIDVARYDTSHGRPHRDLVSPAGRLREKFWLEDLNFKNALNLAIDDFKQNHEAYVRAQSKIRHPQD